MFEKTKRSRQKHFEFLETQNDFVIFKTTVWKLHPKRTLINDSSYTTMLLSRNIFSDLKIFLENIGEKLFNVQKLLWSLNSSK